MRKKIETPGLDFDLWQIDGSANSSVSYRYVVHFLVIPFDGTHGDAYESHQKHAAKMLYGSKYRAKWYGGGIVFQAYAGDPVRHVLAAIRSAETGEHFIDAYSNIA